MKIISEPVYFEYQECDEEIMPLGGIPIIGYLLSKLSLNQQVNQSTISKIKNDKIKNHEIIRAMIGLCAQGKFDYAAITELRDDVYFKDALEIKHVPSEERLRQRFDAFPLQLIPILDQQTIELLTSFHASLTPTYRDYVPIDVDVTPFDNSNTKKEGISCTYKIFDGYAPIMAYIGSEGYLLNCELREGRQHSQTGTKDFLTECINRAEQLTREKVLVRLDSGNDAFDNEELFLERNVDFLCKRNFRRSKDKTIERIRNRRNLVGVRTIHGNRVNIYQMKVAEKRLVLNEEKIIYRYYELKEILEESGQILLIPTTNLEGYSSSLDEDIETIKEIYHMHGTCEQFHSEIKTDMGIERMPSGKFETNAILLHIAMLTYNLLRLTGQSSLDVYRSKKDITHGVVRRRLSTVIKNMIMMASKYVRHARKKIIKACKHNLWINVVQQVYERLHCTVSQLT